MIVSHLYLIQPVSVENVTISAQVTLRFSQCQLIHVHTGSVYQAAIHHSIWYVLRQKTVNGLKPSQTAHF